jgi:hypothetical protein
VAAQRLVTLTGISQASEAHVNGLAIEGHQSETSGIEEDRIDTEAQHAAPSLESFSHEPRSLAEEIDDEPTRHGEAAHVVTGRPHRLLRTVVYQRGLRRRWTTRNERGPLGH